MAKRFIRTFNNALIRNSLDGVAMPFSWCGFVRWTGDTGDNNLTAFSIASPTDDSNYFQFVLRPLNSVGLQYGFRVSSGVAGASIVQAGTLDQNWHHVGFVAGSATDRRIYLDGSLAGTQTTPSVTPGSLSRMSYGQRYSLGPTLWLGGDLAECALYLGDQSAHFLDLSQGMSPSEVPSIVHYLAMVADQGQSEFDRSGNGFHFSIGAASNPGLTHHIDLYDRVAELRSLGWVSVSAARKFLLSRL